MRKVIFIFVITLAALSFVLPQYSTCIAQTVNGATPSPPKVKEKWAGTWKGNQIAHVRTIAGPLTKEDAFEIQVSDEGKIVRLVGLWAKGDVMVLEKAPNNPNIATMNETISGGATKVDLAVFLRDGRLYFKQHHEVVGGGVVGDTTGSADRMK